MASELAAGRWGAKMTIRQRIGLRQIRALKPGDTVWDASLSGFGARRQKSEAVSYVLYYRTVEGRQRWYTIGRHGAPWTPDTAREEAKRLLGDVAHKADPAAEKRAARNAQTVSELCDLYLADAEAGRLVTRRRSPKKASTLVSDRGRIERHPAELTPEKIAHVRKAIESGEQSVTGMAKLLDVHRTTLHKGLKKHG